MTRIPLFLLFLLASPGALAQQSAITEADGASCMGDDKSRKETQTAALQEAKRLAVEYSGTHLESETVVENFELKADLVKAFSRADVKVVEILDEEWDDPTTGDCYTIRIKAEVIPKSGSISDRNTASMLGNPRAPLTVRLWTDRDTYQRGDAMRIYLQGNKPFYARLLYVMADGNQLQLLPNRHRRENYFAGSTILEIPEAKDQFELVVGEPFGKEKLILYASTAQLGNIELTPANEDVYLVTDTGNVASKTRGISIQKPGSAAKKPVVEFAETSVDVTTRDVPAGNAKSNSR